MKKLASVLVVTLALLLSACGGTPPQPIDVITPAPWPGGTSATPQTTPSTDPTQEELSAQAEQAYRAFFNEWKRLELEGGAAEPTPILLANGAEKYLEGVMLFLRGQKALGYAVDGEVPATQVVPRPGETGREGGPRVTLAGCSARCASMQPLTQHHLAQDLPTTEPPRCGSTEQRKLWP